MNCPQKLDDRGTQSGGVSQPVSHRAEPLQSELGAIVVLVADLFMHARFERIKTA
jgi:hypothetical protein